MERETDKQNNRLLFCECAQILFFSLLRRAVYLKKRQLAVRQTVRRAFFYNLDMPSWFVLVVLVGTNTNHAEKELADVCVCFYQPHI